MDQYRVAWQSFIAVAEGRDDFAKTFVLIAPNVTIFERLRSDFAGARIFSLDLVIPNELRSGAMPVGSRQGDRSYQLRSTGASLAAVFTRARFYG
jgi:hypothetical protein